MVCINLGWILGVEQVNLFMTILIITQLLLIRQIRVFQPIIIQSTAPIQQEVRFRPLHLHLHLHQSVLPILTAPRFPLQFLPRLVCQFLYLVPHPFPPRLQLVQVLALRLALPQVHLFLLPSHHP